MLTEDALIPKTNHPLYWLGATSDAHITRLEYLVDRFNPWLSGFHPYYNGGRYDGSVGRWRDATGEFWPKPVLQGGQGEPLVRSERHLAGV